MCIYICASLHIDLYGVSILKILRQRYPSFPEHAQATLVAAEGGELCRGVTIVVRLTQVAPGRL